MIKIVDNIVTAFFVVVLGILWYCSSKYYVKPSQYIILVYDVFDKQSKIDGLRTKFKTLEVTQSYISEYQKRFVCHSFSIAQEMPIIKNTSHRIFKKIQR